jgi:replication initiation protein RepC
MAEEWTILIRETRDIATALRKVENPDEMAFGVASLERRQKQARERLETLLAVTPAAASEAVNSDPKGTEYRPHQYTYKLTLHPKQDTVIADKGCSRASVDTVLEPRAPSAETGAEKGSEQARPQSTPSPSVRDDGTVLRLRCDELLHLAPKLRSYIASPDPGWRDIVDAADWLRHDLGVSKSLWGEACLAMGREQAAIALAIVSAKPPEHFRSSPGGYFHGMVTKAKAGHLNLDRTIWKLRGERKDSQPWRPQMRPGGGFGRARPG